MPGELLLSAADGGLNVSMGATNPATKNMGTVDTRAFFYQVNSQVFTPVERILLSIPLMLIEY